MTPERWQQLGDLYRSALEQTPAERAAFLDRACAGDATMRHEVESLIASHEQQESFLDQPALAHAAHLLAAAPRTLVPGQRVGHYTVLAPIGAGGMGEVFLATDPRLGRRVALKLLPSDLARDAERRVRFEREARAASALNHPNVCAIYDVGEAEDGRHFIAMEYVEGRTLRAHLQNAGLKLTEALEIAVQVAGALAAAHAAGVVHRDIKPENLMLRPDGYVKVLDFGLAKLAEQPTTESAPTRALVRTETGAVTGTVSYMSPEQARGEAVDARSDIFSLGIVLYEMVSGRQPFAGESVAETLSAILTREPPPITKYSPAASARLQATLKKALAKDKQKRYQTANDLLGDLKELRRGREEVSGDRRLQQIRQPRVAVPLALVAAALCAAAIWSINRNANMRWAKDEALPQISRLHGEGKNWAAFALAEQANTYIPGDPGLTKLWPRVSAPVSFETTPAGAAVHIREYGDLEGPWKHIGQSPLTDVDVPLGHFRWRIEKQGYAPVEGMGRAGGRESVSRFTLTLDEANTAPPGMVRVQGDGAFALDLPGYQELKPVRLDDYWMDRYEVTNEQFSAFVDAGGYQNRAYWKEPFIKDGRAITWEEAMREFHDATGRHGPALWEQGEYPRGEGDHPAAGISWYEAAAYAEFAGKSLPTLHHWYNAAVADSIYWHSSPTVAALSNFDSRGPARVGTHQGLGPHGTYDMAGNVKEWCWNEADDRRRYLPGGAWNEPAYMFFDPDSQPPLSRAVGFGFRCVKYMSAGPIAKDLTEPIEPLFRNYDEEKPVPDELFRIYGGLYSYDKAPLDATTESVDETNADWTKEKVTFDAAYGNERVIAYLFLPRKAAPPYQTVIFFPGAFAIHTRSSSDLGNQSINALVKSGRAVLFPVFKGTFERGAGLGTDVPNTTVSYRDFVISWSKDLGRSIDYLQTRTDVDQDKIGFYGISWGAMVGPVLTAVEGRIKVSILVSGGLYFTRALPEVDTINFLPRVKVPVLMVAGRNDFFYPVETSQKPMFRLLGTPQAQKRHVILDSGHTVPRNALTKEVVDWLDRYLGPAS